MTSVVEIANMALANKLGANPITSLLDDSKGAKAVNRCYTHVRDMLQRSHPWKFTKTRVVLAPLVSTPAFGYDYAYEEPGDSIRILDVDTDLGWVLEDGEILTDEGPTLNVAYQKIITDSTKFDPLFIEILSTRLAYQVCEEITQSTAKKTELARDLEKLTMAAKAMDSQQSSPKDLKEDAWVEARW